jgi:hypothetical protein
MSFFGLEQPIITHLLATCPNLGYAAGVADAASIARNMQFVQEQTARIGDTESTKFGACFVFPHTDFFRIGDESGADAECQFNKSYWVVAVATSQKRDMETTTKGLASLVRQANSVLVVQVLDAMRVFRWTALNDGRAGMRTVRRVNVSGLPGVSVTDTVGGYVTLLCFEADLVGSYGSAPQPGVAYPITGTQGPPGPQGPQGLTGATGAQGPQGVQGPPGTGGGGGASTVRSGAGVPSAALGADGDFYIDTTANAIYGPKTVGAWGASTSIVGPVGPSGATGATGAMGAAGAAGPQGIQGAAGNAGATGATGAAGTTGAQGPQGLVGATGAQGLQGVAGPVGSQGAQGIQGVAGTNGTNGADGKTVRSGAGVPGAGLGVDGDFYINTAANTIYGPKSAGSWGAATSLVGPPGLGGGAATIYEATVDFGANPVSAKSFTIAQVGATIGQKVLMSVSGNMPGGLAIDELEMDPISCVARVEAADQITALLSTNHVVRGQRNVLYQLG